MRLFLARLGLACALSIVGSAGAAGIKVQKALLQTEAYAEFAGELAQDDPLRELASGLSANLKLPKSLHLRYAECGEANAFYDPASRTISLCFELIEQLAEDFGRRLDDDEELADAVAGAYTFIALHEVGHALVDVLELPITGREEDAVDQLSAWLLIGEDDGNAAVLNAAMAFSIAGEGYELADGDFADSHSLDQQRYFNMVCWVYGSNPERQAALAEEAGLPSARAEGCAEEYARIDASWSKLLAPYVRE